MFARPGSDVNFLPSSSSDADVIGAEAQPAKRALQTTPVSRTNSFISHGERFSDNYFSQAYARLHPQGIAFTITAHFRNPGSGRFTHYRDARSLTMREAARLQSFDDAYIFHGFETDQERHIGNAVPPLLAERLAKYFGTLVSVAK